MRAFCFFWYGISLLSVCSSQAPSWALSSRIPKKETPPAPLVKKEALQNRESHPSSNPQDFRLFDDLDENKIAGVILLIVRALKERYVDEIDKEKMSKILEGGINGILSALDPHSGFCDKRLLEEMKGEFGGLGVEVFLNQEGYLQIANVLEGTPPTPAELVHLKPGDVILTVDGAPVARSLLKAVGRMRGKAGTQVTLLVKRGADKAFNVTLTRQMIQIQSVKWRTETDVGYVRLSVFDEKTVDLLKEALFSLQKSLGTKMKGLILDLRNNPGGLLDKAVEAASFFLPKGNVVLIKSRKKTKALSVIPNQLIVGKGGKYDVPIVVLVNESSASAAEVFAGALKDHRRAVIVGTATFGKGSVQEVRIFPDGAIKLTVARFYTPNKNPIQSVGVIPNVAVSANLQEADRKDHNIFLKEGNLEGALPAQAFDERSLSSAPVSSNQTPPSAPRTQEEKKEPFDAQLQYALAIIRALSSYYFDMFHPRNSIEPPAKTFHPTLPIKEKMVQKTPSFSAPSRAPSPRSKGNAKGNASPSKGRPHSMSGYPSWSLSLRQGTGDKSISQGTTGNHVALKRYHAFHALEAHKKDSRESQAIFVKRLGSFSKSFAHTSLSFPTPHHQQPADPSATIPFLTLLPESLPPVAQLTFCFFHNQRHVGV